MMDKGRWKYEDKNDKIPMEEMELQKKLHY